MVWFKFLCSLFALFVLIPSVYATVEDATRDFDRARKLLDEGQESQSLISLTDFLRRYPNESRSPDVQYLIGEIYYRRSDCERAIEEYNKVIRFDGHDVDARANAGFRIGECLKRLKKPLEAAIEWSAVIRKYPKSKAALESGVSLAGLKKEFR